MSVRPAYTLLFILFFLPDSLQARALELPVRFQEDFLQYLLDNQVFTEADTRARVWDDGQDCNYLELYEPVLALGDGQVTTRSSARAQVGTAIAGRCLALPTWEGFVEIDQVPSLGPEPGMVQFRVVDTRMMSADGESRGVIGTLWDWTKRYTQPRFERLRIDLNPMLSELGQLIPTAFPGHSELVRRTLGQVDLINATILEQHIELTLRFDVPDQAPAPLPVDPQPVLTEAELERWTEAWQRWDAFLTWFIKQAGFETDRQDIRMELFSVLLGARQDIIGVLVPESGVDPDPVPELFSDTWAELAPVLRELSQDLPPDTALRYMGFIAAADALATIEALGEQIGFELSADTLRYLARMANPDLVIDPLVYDTAVDADLRELFGFGPPLELDEPMWLDLRPGGAFAGLMFGILPMAILQDPHYKGLVSRLNGWVPTIRVLDEYLPLMQQLLDRVIGVTLNNKGLDKPYFDIFRPLVLATAWQESCWRQFIRQGGEIITIRSHAGAIGIMQINQYVWRGFYDLDGLHNDVGYNARAGTEITHHYLVDYAIARGEHKHEGGLENLARATYAMYNGGPRHMTRYRNPGTSRSLRAIDRSFWEKYEAIQDGDPLAVAQCYVGG